MVDHYITFLRYCLREDDTPLSQEERVRLKNAVGKIVWHDLRKFAQEQAIEGVYFRGMQRFFSQQSKAFTAESFPNKPSDEDVMDWMGDHTKICRLNETVNDRCAWVSKNFLQEGYRSCILKGQGNALYYPDPMMRMPGDIDIWIEGGAEKVINYVDAVCTGKKRVYHHIEFMSSKGVEIEVHYRPSWLNNPFYNHRLQQWFEKEREACFQNQKEDDAGNTYNVPTWRFNVVFQVCHILNHIMHEGIGLRQIIDYYYLLRSRTCDAIERKEIEATLRDLGLLPVSKAVGWICSDLLGLEEKFLLVKPDRRVGRVILKEMIAGGNFGQHDRRVLSGVQDHPFKKNIQRFYRDFRLLLYFPSESLWEPLFRLYHFFWRKKHREKRRA